MTIRQRIGLIVLRAAWPEYKKVVKIHNNKELRWEVQYRFKRPISQKLDLIGSWITGKDPF